MDMHRWTHTNFEGHIKLDIFIHQDVFKGKGKAKIPLPFSTCVGLRPNKRPLRACVCTVCIHTLQDSVHAIVFHIELRSVFKELTSLNQTLLSFN